MNQKPFGLACTPFSPRRTIRAAGLGIFLGLLLLVLFLPSRPAQAWPGDMVLAWSSSTPDDGMSAAWGDMDGDGDQDLAIGNFTQPTVRVYRNDGGTMTAFWSSTTDDFIAASVSWGDMDGNGTMELAVGYDGYPLRVYMCNTDTFDLIWTGPTYSTHEVAWGDFNHDSYADLAVASYAPGGVRVYVSNGTAFPVVHTYFTVSGWNCGSIDWGDFNNDGWADLAIGTYNSFGIPLAILTNSGGTGFTSYWPTTGATATTNIVWGDWDNDGDQDLATALMNGPVNVYRNNGNGTVTLIWTSAQTFLNLYASAIDLADWDADGDVDLAVSSFAGQNTIFRNNTVGGVGITDATRLTVGWTAGEADLSVAVALGDWDGDLRMDLAVGNQNGLTRVYSHAGGVATLDWSSDEQDVTMDVAWADYDNDGDLDLAVANLSEPNRIYRNDQGRLHLAWSAAAVADTRALAWGDVDNDGDLDLAAGNSGPNQLYRNDGGVMTLIWTAPAAENTWGLAWGDVDNDADLDLLVGNRTQGGYPSGPNRLYRNDGGGVFTSVWTAPTDFYASVPITWADFNRDGKLDVLTGSGKLYRNDSSGGVTTLVEVWTCPSGTGGAASWGDWDNDGDLDLAYAGIVYRNDTPQDAPTPTLTLAWYVSDNWCSVNSTAWGDWDGDGDLDLALGRDLCPSVIYRNNTVSNPGVTDARRLALAWSAPFSEWTFNVAWGDVDNDGDLDLAVGNYGFSGYGVQPNRIYRNETANLGLAWASGETNFRAVAWGDMDGDGDLDLAAARSSTGVQLYQNSSGQLDPLSTAATSCAVTDLAWGNWDNDADLDLAIGCAGSVQVLGNSGGSWSSVWQRTVSDLTSLAWADYDGDGDLDLALGRSTQPSEFLQNQTVENPGVGDAGRLTVDWLTLATKPTQAVAWADYDGDGDPDLALGNYGQPNQLYRNDTFYWTLVWTAPVTENTRALAWGDYDNDGDPDLAVGNGEQFNRVYRNEGGALAPAWSSAEAEDTWGVAWADDDGDGDLDLAVVNETESIYGFSQRTRVYRNDSATLASSWSSAEQFATYGLSWADYDGDGDPDLVTAEGGRSSLLYKNRSADSQRLLGLTRAQIQYPGEAAGEGYASARIQAGPTLPISYTLFDPESDPALFVRAYYSYDDGGTWHEAIAATGAITRNLAASPAGTAHVYNWDVYGSGFFGLSDDVVFRLDVYQGPAQPGAYLYQYALTSARTMPFRLRGNQVRVLKETTPGAGASVYRLPAGQEGMLTPYQDATGQLFHTNSSGYLTGRGEINLGDRLVALLPIRTGPPSTLEEGFEGAFPPPGWSALDLTPGGAHAPDWERTNATARNGTYSARHAQSVSWEQDDWLIFPTLEIGPNSMLRFWEYVIQPDYYILRGLYFCSGSCDNPPANYVQVALYPPAFPGGIWRQRFTDLSSLTGKSGRLAFRYVGYLGDHWYIDDVEVTGTPDDPYDLYDTNAVPSLSGVTPFTVTVLGVQTLVVSDSNPVVLFNLDVSLQWDARHDTQYLDQLAFDFQRTSAFLYDWTDGQAALGRVTLYHDRVHWDDADVRIYATNRMRPNAAQGGIVDGVITDPEHITITYAPGMVHMGAVWNRYGDPGGALDEDWPRTLAHELGHWALYLDDNYLGFDEAGRLIPVAGCPGAMTDPYREDWPYDELHPEAAWLPECADTLSQRVFGRADWATLEQFYPALDGTHDNAGPSRLPLAVTELDWVEPVAPPDTLEDPTFYLVDEGGGMLQLGSSARAVLLHDDLLTDLGRPTLDRVLARGARLGDRLCVYEPTAGRLGCETIAANDTQLMLHELPTWQPEILLDPQSTSTMAVRVTNVPAGLVLSARLYPFSGAGLAAIALTWDGGGYAGTFSAPSPIPAGYVHIWVDEPEPRREALTDYALGSNPGRMQGGMGAPSRGRSSPAVSADGQAILFGNLEFAQNQFYALQSLSHFSTPLDWATPVGHAYRLLASPGAPNLTAASLSIAYMADDVVPGEERWIRMYYWDGTAWTILPTTLDMTENMAAAPCQGEGTYALMSSIEVPLQQGWNLLAYPVPQTRPVTETLLSIQGAYTLVYGYDGSVPADPWAVYGPGAPAWVSDLDTFVFGRGYWISATEAITLFLKGTGGEGLASGFPNPPATYYGQVLSSAYFTPTPGLTVTAWVGDQLCGQALTREEGGLVVYVVSVRADDEVPGCGTPGRTVELRIAEQRLSPLAAWNNGRLWPLTLRPDAPPTAADDTANTPEDTAILVDVLANDLEPDAEMLVVEALGMPAHGTAVLSEGLVFYTPDGDYCGADAFAYVVRAGRLTDTADVAITIIPVNDPPIAADDIHATAQEVPLIVPAPGVLANDSDIDGDPLTVTLAAAPVEGAVDLSPDGSFVYTPTIHWSGVVSFTYSASDGALTDTAVVTILVDPGYDAVIAADDAYATNQDVPLAAAAPGVLGNDIDLYGHPLTAALAAAPGVGALALHADGSFVYTPTLGWSGAVSFTYVASDGALTDTAVARITVHAVNTAPQAAGDAYTVTMEMPLIVATPGVLSNDGDADGDLLLAILETGPASGTLSLGSNGSLIYLPPAGFSGLVSFTYRAGDGLAVSDPAAVTITVQPRPTPAAWQIYLPLVVR